MSRSRGLRAVAAALAVLSGSCTTMRSPTPGTVVSEPGPIRLDFVEWNASTDDLLEGAVPEAARALGRWGGLHEPVTITELRELPLSVLESVATTPDQITPLTGGADGLART